MEIRRKVHSLRSQVGPSPVGRSFLPFSNCLQILKTDMDLISLRQWDTASPNSAVAKLKITTGLHALGPRSCTHSMPVFSARHLEASDGLDTSRSGFAHCFSVERQIPQVKRGKQACGEAGTRGKGRGHARNTAPDDDSDIVNNKDGYASPGCCVYVAGSRRWLRARAPSFVPISGGRDRRRILPEAEDEMAAE